jgi:hypothetical protein
MTTYDEKKQVEFWEKVRKKGINNYYLRQAFSMGLIITFTMAFVKLIDHGFTEETIKGIFNLRFLGSILMGIIAGLLYGIFSWRYFEGSYQKILKKNQ